MFLSKNAKRFMSTAAVLAMTVASLVVAPKVEAAGGDPTVGPETISDAKVSVNETGTGIRYMVSATLAKNYSEDLGIELTAGTNATKTISLKNGAKKLYSRTENEDGSVTVQYAVAVTNIPADQKDTAIKAQGFASTKKAANEVSYTVTEAAKIAGYTFDEDGSLTSLGGTKLIDNADGGTVWGHLTLPDNKDLTEFSGKTVKVSFKIRMAGKKAEKGDTAKFSYNDGKNFVGFSPEFTLTNEWQTITYKKQITEITKASPIDIYFDGYGKTWRTNGDGVEFYYKGLSIAEDTTGPVLLDLSTITLTDGAEYTVNEDGSATIEAKGKYNGYIQIEVPEDVLDGASKVEVALENDTTNKGGGHVLFKFENSEDNTDKFNWDEVKGNYGDTSLDLVGKSSLKKIIIQAQDDPTTFTIKHIKFL